MSNQVVSCSIYVVIQRGELTNVCTNLFRLSSTVRSHGHRFGTFGNVSVAVGVGDASLFDT